MVASASIINPFILFLLTSPPHRILRWRTEGGWDQREKSQKCSGILAGSPTALFSPSSGARPLSISRCGHSPWHSWVKAACKLLSLVCGTQGSDSQRLRSHLTSDFLSREWAISPLCPWSHPALFCILNTVLTTFIRTTELPFGIYFRP